MKNVKPHKSTYLNVPAHCWKLLDRQTRYDILFKNEEYFFIIGRTTLMNRSTIVLEINAITWELVS